MKPRSIIFLIVAAVLIVAGIIVCAVGSAGAKSDGIDIYSYSYDENDRTVTEVDISNEAIGKISLELGSCSVRIEGGGDRPTVKLVGFEKYRYSLSTTGSELKIKDGFGPTALIGMSSDGISFDGMRYLFPFVSRGIHSHAETCEVIISLPDKLAVRKISINVERGDVTLDSLSGKADIVINVGEGNIASSSKTDASVSIAADTGAGDILFENPIYVGKSDLHTADGNIRLVITGQTECEYQLLAPLGKISVYTADAGDSYITETTLPTKLTATADKGSITLVEPGVSESTEGDTETAETE